MFHVPNKNRERSNPYLGSDDSYGNNGFFNIKHPKILDYEIIVQASDGGGWEHVSVTIAPVGKPSTRCPTWYEMCLVKEMFWDDNDCVVQYHPPKSDYVSMHPFCLHLWRPTSQEIPRPPSIMVGIKV